MKECNGYAVGERVRLFAPHSNAGRVGAITGFYRETPRDDWQAQIQLDLSEDDSKGGQVGGKYYRDPPKVNAEFADIRHEGRRRRT